MDSIDAPSPMVANATATAASDGDTSSPTAVAVAVPLPMLPAIITHLDALGQPYAAAGHKEGANTASFLDKLNKDKTVPANMEAACAAREHTTIKGINSALASKEAAMENQGFGPAFPVTQARAKGSDGASVPSSTTTSTGGGNQVGKDVLVKQLTKRFGTIARIATERAAKVDAAGRQRGRVPYPLSRATAKGLMRAANFDRGAPGVEAATQLPGDNLRDEDLMKLAQISSACVYRKDVPAVTDGTPITPGAGGVYPALPELVVDMDELFFVMREVYLDSDKGSHSTAHSLTPLQEALWWACFVMPSNQSWASRYMMTEACAQAQTHQRSTDAPIMSRHRAVSAFAAVRTDPTATVQMAVDICMHHPDEYDEHLVPAFVGTEVESEAGMRARLTEAFTHAAIHTPMPTEAMLNACMTARGGPLSPVLQNYAQSGAAADWNPATFCANRGLPPGRERAMFIFIMTGLDVYGGGISAGEGGLWKVLNRISDNYTANDNPDRPPDVRGSKRPLSRASSSGGRGKGGDQELLEGDGEESAEREIAVAARAIAAKYAPAGAASSEAQTQLLAREKLARIKDAIASLLAVKERDGGLLDGGRTERLRLLREKEMALEMDVTSDLI